MSSRNRSPFTRRAAARPLPDLAGLAAFEPSEPQRRFMELALADDLPLRISRVCETLGIARSTYYRWLDDPAFRGWMALQWATALLADGGRLLSIARLRAETDYRYFKSLLELIFDPRGLGLLATWQQRMAAPSLEVDQSADDSDVETETSDVKPETPSLGAQASRLRVKQRTAQAACATGDPQNSPVPPPPSAAPVKSTTYESAAQQNRNPVPHFPPSWPNPGRFHG